MFKHTIYSDKVIINAPIERVWEVLMDLPRYPEWNPFTYEVVPHDGSLYPGANVDLYVRMPLRGDRVSTEKVARLEAPTQLAWGMTMINPWLLKAQRDQVLEKLDDNRCSYQTWDAFRGLLTPVVVGLFGKDMKNGFDGVAHALKKRCETADD